ncbi:MAG: hypothetical protein HYT98_02500 [Candidatus Sungbacteria bacterium]|nr:hypothetical protein [Candidatus Sungbacteria bacterium]
MPIVSDISQNNFGFADQGRDHIWIPIVLSLFYIATEFIRIKSGNAVISSAEEIPILFLHGFLTFILLPISLGMDILVYYGHVHIHLSSKYFDPTAFSIKFFTRIVYGILTIIALIRVVVYIIY